MLDKHSSDGKLNSKIRNMRVATAGPRFPAVWPGFKSPPRRFDGLMVWHCCWFIPLLREGFLWVLRFTPLLKNLQFQILIESRRHEHFQTCYLTPLCNRLSRLQLNLYLHRVLEDDVTGVAYFPLFFFLSCVSPIKAILGGRPYIWPVWNLWKPFKYCSSEKN